MSSILSATLPRGFGAQSRSLHGDDQRDSDCRLTSGSCMPVSAWCYKDESESLLHVHRKAACPHICLRNIVD